MAAYTYETAVPVLQGERPEQVVHKPFGHAGQSRATAGPLLRRGGLEQVASTVKLMAPAQVLPHELWVLALEPRVEVTVRALGLRENCRGLLDEVLHLRRKPSHAVPGCGLQDLVNVGIRKMQTFVWALAPAALSHTFQIADRSRRDNSVYAMRKCLGAVAPLPVA